MKGKLNKVLGKETVDGWWTKGVLINDQGYVLSKSEGFNVLNTFVDKANITEALEKGVPLTSV